MRTIKIFIVLCSATLAANMPAYGSNQFPNGSCEGPNKSASPSKTGCGYAGDTRLYVAPNADMFAADLSGMELTGAKLMDVDFLGCNSEKRKFHQR